MAVSHAETAAAEAGSAEVKPLPINLETVFRLAEDQNPRIAGARARIGEATAHMDMAAWAWLPNVNVGTTFTRHEGGIDNEDGRFIHSSYGTLFAGMEIRGVMDLREAIFKKIQAERQLWQRQGELRKISSETLLEAATTYVDLLAARNGEMVALNLQKDLEALLERTKKLAQVERGAEVEVARIQAHLKGSQRTVAELREQAARASAKLVYLLGLDPAASLVPARAEWQPFDLVDLAPPVTELVNRALSNGPGMREMEGLLSVAQDAQARACGHERYMPAVELRMLEGGFGTGPGDDMRWDNRWDLGLQVRWNLTELLTAKEKLRVIGAKVEEARWAHQDLRSRLTLGVHEAREAILGSSEQIRLGKEQIAEARRAHDLSFRRLTGGVPGSSASEVLLALQAVSIAEIGYHTAIRSHNQAQLRLLMVLGQAGKGAGLKSDGAEKIPAPK